MTKHPATSYDWKHAALPAEAQARLREAAKTPATAADPLARVKAIDKATRWVRRTYPEFFKQEM